MSGIKQLIQANIVQDGKVSEAEIKLKFSKKRMLNEVSGK
jgi:hypothetical protein